MRFQDKVVVITGAAQGLGALYAERFAEEGAKIAVCDLAPCEDTVASIESGGGEALGASVDVTKADQTSDFAADVVRRFGTVDVLINNAALYGALSFGPFDQISEDEWDACMAVNVKGIWQMSRAVFPAMKEQKAGAIVNIASLAATFGMPYGVHYSASKGAVIALTRALAREVARYDIRVNAVAPSLIATPGTTKFLGEREGRVTEAVVGGQALKSQVAPEDVAGSVMFLASDDARMLTGQTVAVDGGTVML